MVNEPSVFEPLRLYCNCLIYTCTNTEGVFKGLTTFVSLSKWVDLPSEKGSTLKGKNLLRVGANSFLLE